MTTAVYRNPACSRLGGDGVTCPRSHGHTAVNKKKGRKVSLLGFYVFNSRILCSYPYTFLALSLLHVGEMISTMREFSIACFGLKTMPSVWYPMGSASVDVLV